MENINVREYYNSILNTMSDMKTRKRFLIRELKKYTIMVKSMENKEAKTWMEQAEYNYLSDAIYHLKNTLQSSEYLTAKEYKAKIEAYNYDCYTTRLKREREQKEYKKHELDQVLGSGCR